MGKRFAIPHWLSMDIGGRIPPLLDGRHPGLAPKGGPCQHFGPHRQ
jgi:hypothetical protein